MRWASGAPQSGNGADFIAGQKAMTVDGTGLIFVLSQPRAGSTLLQRMFARHSDVYTRGEPWIMLPPFYVKRPDRCQTEYSSWGAQIGYEEFIKALPNGEGDYYEGVRRMFAYLYFSAAHSAGRRFFLDKTPRYFLIIPELLRTFPRASFVFLLRNPLAVLASMRETWSGDNWLGLGEQRLDLLEAPRLLNDGRNLIGERAYTLQYEQLVIDPENELRRLCGWLGIGFDPEMIEYGRTGVEEWVNGDPCGVYRFTRPTPYSIDKWRAAIRDPQLWRLAREYLYFLGPQQLADMGYSWEALAELIDAAQPRRRHLFGTFSLRTVLKEHSGTRRILLRVIQRVRNGIVRHGVVGASRLLVRKSVAMDWRESSGSSAPQVLPMDGSQVRATA